MKRPWPLTHRQPKLPIKDRIQAALVAAGGSMRFDQLADAIYPDPASHNAPSRGGPPGCYRALSTALDKHKFAQHSRGDANPSARIVYAHNAGKPA